MLVWRGNGYMKGQVRGGGVAVYKIGTHTVTREVFNTAQIA